jgi:hypothetical protein
MTKREDAYSTVRDLRALIFTWNVDAAKPAELDATEAGVFAETVRAAGRPDIVAFGFQEVVDLESRRMMAKNITMGGSKKKDKQGEVNVSDRVSGAYKRWHDRLAEVMRGVSRDEVGARENRGGYTMVACDHLVGLFSAVFVKTAEMGNVRDAQIKLVKRGMGGRYGNKVSINDMKCGFRLIGT